MRPGRQIDQLIAQAKDQNGTAREFQSPAAPDQHISEEIVVADTANSTAALKPEGASKVSPELMALIKAANDAGEVLTRHSDDVLFPLMDEVRSAGRDVPHFTSNLDGTPYWSTANDGAVQFARRCIAKDPERRLPDSAALRQLVAASVRRKRAIKALRISSGLVTVERESERLGSLSVAAQNAVFDHRCCTVADLRAKVTFLLENEMVETDMRKILPDLDRIIAEGGR